MSGSIVPPSYHVTANGKPVTANGKPVTVNGKPVTANGKDEQLHVVDIEEEDVTPGLTSHDSLQPTTHVGDNSTVMTFHDIVYTIHARHRCCKSSPKDIIKGVRWV